MSAIPAGYKQTEVGVIPVDWDCKALQELTDPARPIGYGIVQTGKSVLNGVRCVRVLDMVGLIDPDQLITTSQEISQAYKRTLLRENDLVIALRGKIGAVAVIRKELAGANLTRGVALLSASDSIDCGYLSQYLSSSVGKSTIEKNLNGSALQEIPIASLRKIPAVVPPLPEQRAIAAALSDVDALLAKLDQFIAKKRDLKQAAMQQLLTGQTRLPGFSGEWEVTRLGDALTEIGDGATPSTANIANFGGNIPWVVIDDIRDEIVSTRNTLTEKGLMSCAAHLWPPGTLILSTGATIGEVGIAKVPLATKQGICGLRFDPNSASSIFMKYWFVKNKQLLLSKAQGSSIKEVRAPTLVQFSVHLPGIEEQTAIATVLSDMDAELAALEARRDKTRALKQGMMQELLTGRIRLV